jgi:hypothetical protein
MSDALDFEMDLLKTAYGLARQHGLLSDGVIYCWACSQKPALMPSLHCPRCLADHWRRNGIVSPLCVNRAQSPEDVRAVCA